MFVIYHSPCRDGFTAAWVAREFLGEYPSDTYFKGVYGAPAPYDVTGEDVLLVDFSYKRSEIETMLEQCNRMVILDHHKSAQADLGSLSHPKLEVVFDMDRSGARIAWDYFFPQLRPPKALLAVEDYDLWRFDLANTREICEGLGLYPQTFEAWNEVMEDTALNGLVSQGKTLLQRQQKDAASLIEFNSSTITVDGVTVPCANVPYFFSSDIGNKLSVGHPFSVTYSDTATHRKFSLRSQEGGADVSEIAVRFGGGGHAHAAGFEAPLLPLNITSAVSHAESTR